MFDNYKHLGDDPRDGVIMGIESVAAQVVSLNYGFHRMLCALVRYHEKRFPKSALAREIRAVLVKGHTT